MCGPAAFVAASLVMSAMQAYNQRQQGKYAKAVADQNADVAEAQAQDSINRGNIQAEEVRRRNRQTAGTQAATMGATGADLGSGSSLDIFGDTAQFGTLDALTTVNNAQREAYGYQVQAMNATAQGNSALSQSRAAVTQTLLSAPLKAYGAYQTGGGTWSPFTQSSAAPISSAVGTPTGR
ncbi:TPA: virion core protein, T7 gp14 family [Raoultella ornithinolytica]